MADHPELHSKIFGFLMAEWARKENRQLIEVELLFAPGGGYRDEPIRKWVRADEPDFFTEAVNVEKLVTLIIEIAEGEADAKASGKHRFVIRTKQYLGERAHMSFALSPSYTGSVDETAMVPGGGGGGARGADVAAAQILASNNGQLMRINAQMFDAALRPLAQQNTQLLTELIALREENSQLQRRLSEAESNRMDREFQIAMAAEKNARTNAGFQKLLQIGTIVAAKFTAGNAEQMAQLGEANPLAMLINDLKQSLRPDQLNVIMQTLDMSQKMLFMEIVNRASPPESAQGQAPSAPPAGGMSGAR